MNIEPLIPMANRIGDFFASMQDQDQGMQEIAQHIRLFWDPRMRHALLGFIAQHPDGQGEAGHLHPLVLQAVQRHQTSLLPRSAV